MESNKRIITVLFSRYSDFTSNIIYFASGRCYTHVAIALDDDYEYFYSFNKKGFRKEYPKKHLTRIYSVAYKIEVTEAEFLKIKQKIKDFENIKDSLKYSTLGVLFCFLRIKYKFKNKYFCSQFVAEVLEEIEDFKLKKDCSLYYPNKLHSLVHLKLPAKEIDYNPFFNTTKR